MLQTEVLSKKQPMLPTGDRLTIGIVREGRGVDEEFASDGILGKGILVEKNAEASGH